MVLDTAAQVAVDSAVDNWAGAETAWEAIEWTLAHDPRVGVPLSESGNIRGFVYTGARSIGQPDVEVIYELGNPEIIVKSAEFSDAKTTFAGRA